MIPILNDAVWQMTPGERAALEGLLSQLRPKLAIEIGTAEGGSLRCIAKHSSEVLSFDLVPPAVDLSELPNVTVHTGDSHRLLPAVLGELAGAGRNVDFVLVDGDHTAAGVEQDVRDLLASDAIRSSVIVFHDTINDEVRAGLERIDYAAEPKVTYCDLNFVAGRLSYGGAFHHQLWGGLGVIVVDATSEETGTASPIAGDAYPPFDLLAPLRDALLMRERAGLATGPGTVAEALEPLRLDYLPPPAQPTGLAHPAELTQPAELPQPTAPAQRAELTELAEVKRRYEQLLSSRSWRITAPLRAAARAIRGAKARR